MNGQMSWIDLWSTDAIWYTQHSSRLPRRGRACCDRVVSELCGKPIKLIVHDRCAMVSVIFKKNMIVNIPVEAAVEVGRPPGNEAVEARGDERRARRWTNEEVVLGVPAPQTESDVAKRVATTILTSEKEPDKGVMNKLGYVDIKGVPTIDKKIWTRPVLRQVQPKRQGGRTGVALTAQWRD